MLEPWKDEPNSANINFNDGTFGYIVRVLRTGHLCGYVGVPYDHSAYGKDYDDVDVDVHGGLTYAANHKPQSDPDGLWWFGFDCCHAYDLCPMLESSFPEYLRDTSAVYRDFAYVTVQVHSLASQLAELRYAL